MRTAGRVTALLLLAALTAACSDGDSENDAEQAGSETPDSSQVSDDCPASTGSLTGYPPEGYGAARSLTVCLYRTGDDGTPAPVWSAELGAGPAEQVVRAVALGRGTDCPAAAAGDEQQVLLRVETANDFGAKPLWHDYLVRLDQCASVVDLTQGDLRGGPTVVAVDGRVLAPWAAEGVADRLDIDVLPDEVASYLESPEG